MKYFLALTFCTALSFHAIAKTKSEGALTLPMNTVFTTETDVTIKYGNGEMGAIQTEWERACGLASKPELTCRTLCTFSSENRPLSPGVQYPDFTIPRSTQLRLVQISTDKSIFGTSSTLSLEGSDFEAFRLSCTSFKITATERLKQLDPTVEEIRESIKGMLSF